MNYDGDMKKIGNRDHVIEKFNAEIFVGFLKIKDSYVSKVEVSSNKIVATALDARLFKELLTIWEFENNDNEDECIVKLEVIFEFKSYLYAYIANLFFLEVSKGILDAFEKRSNFIKSQLKSNKNLF
jgi:ribosome-associated toxin RatA of RatAB toxin-antitoxin module